MFRFPDLQGKAVLVTGGASGIGEALVRAFHREGAKVGFLDLDRMKGERLMAELGERAAFQTADLRDLEALPDAIDRLRERTGPFSVLINNAARDDRHSIDDVTPAYWRERFATNIDHQFFSAQAVHRDMIGLGGGAIICMGSTSYMQSRDSFAAYKTAKSAVVGLMRALARELGEHNIRVNCLIPGWIMTGRQMEMWLTPESEAELLRQQCIKRHLVPEDMAGPALFLASDLSAAMTAQTMIVDGGWV
ncbi:MAG: SDR family NAD(P)-dependent oxidoreductase [Beijerinckiaceae bacterium]|nr:SDR family NAD(P)-dependent oxidoreductase [Beijerinckiaceae bacterium]